MNYSQNRIQNPNFNQNPNIGQNFEVICYSCNTPGHTSRNCNKQINMNQQLQQPQPQQQQQQEFNQQEMQETILVPARTISDFYVRIKNSEQKQGFIPQLNLCNGVYSGNAIVSNNNNKAYMKIFNTNTQPQKLAIPTVELIDFEETAN